MVKLEVVHRLEAVVLLVHLVAYRHVTGVELPFLEARPILLLGFLGLHRKSLHIVDSRHNPVLIMVKHELVLLVVIIPSFWISGLFLRQHKHQVILFKLGVLAWVGDHILDLFHDLLLILDHNWALFVAVYVFESRQVDRGCSVKANRDHLSPRGQVVKQLLIPFPMIVLWHFHMEQVTGGNIREVMVLLRPPIRVVLLKILV